jgi:thiol-disulfide isomerase/thioredoxin
MIPILGGAQRKRWAVLGVLLGFVALGPSSLEGQVLEPRIVHQGEHLEALEGAALTPAEWKRRDTIAIFWASWSPRCREIVPRVQALEARWGQQAWVITVNFQEDPATIRNFLGVESSPPPVYLDTAGTFARRHGVTTLPTLVLFRGGEAIYQDRLRADTDRRLARFFPAE